MVFDRSNGSGGGDVTKTGLIVGIIVAVIISAIVIGWGRLESAKYQRDAEYKTSEYAEYTNKKIAEACVGISKIKKFKCLGDAQDEKRAYQRAEQDLEAQKNSALWAYIMGSAAVIGMGLSVIGVILVWTTFRETRRGADEAMRNVEAFMNAERARIAVAMPLDMSLDRNGAQWLVRIKVTNYGRSPCIVTTVNWGAVESSAWHRNFADVQSASRQVDMIIPVATDTPIEVAFANVPKDAPFVTGSVCYDTQFRRGCVTHFIWRVGEQRGQEIRLGMQNTGHDWPPNT